MIEKLSNSWELVKASAAVLRQDRELLLFPALSSVAMVIVAVSFFVPLAAVGMSGEGDSVSPLAYPVFFLFYFVQYAVIIFFNSALVGAALIRLNGGDPTVSDGLRIARSNLNSILLYALIAASVGVVLRAIRDRAGLIGKLLASVGGLAWSLATFLVVPVLVTRQVGPIEAIKESGRLLKKTWGEQLAGSVGIGFVFGLISFLFALVMIPVIVLAALNAPVGVVIALVVVAVAGLMTLALVSAALNGIYSAALYRFATTGQSAFFEQRLLSGAFRS